MRHGEITPRSRPARGGAGDVRGCCGSPLLFYQSLGCGRVAGEHGRGGGHALGGHVRPCKTFERGRLGNLRPKRLAVVALALAVRLGRALVVRLLLSPTGVVVGGAASLPRAAASKRRAAELLGLAADGAGRRAVAVELAVALALALAAVHFFWRCCGTRRLARALAKATFCCFLVYFCWGFRRDTEIAALQACDKSGSGRAAEVTLQLCGLWNAPIKRSRGGLESWSGRWLLWTACGGESSVRRVFGTLVPKTRTARKTRDGPSVFCKNGARATPLRILAGELTHINSHKYLILRARCRRRGVVHRKSAKTSLD